MAGAQAFICKISFCCCCCCHTHTRTHAHAITHLHAHLMQDIYLTFRSISSTFSTYILCLFASLVTHTHTHTHMSARSCSLFVVVVVNNGVYLFSHPN